MGKLVKGVTNTIFGKPPKAPNYAAAAQEQGAQNIKAAELNAAMNRLDETNPYGSVKYTTTPDSSVPGGNKYSRAITLSPEQQRLYDLESGNQIQGQEVARTLGGRLADSVSNPFSLAPYGQSSKISMDGISGDEVRDSLYQQGMRYAEPRFKRAQESQDVALRNQGLMPGTEAYDNAFGDLQESQNMAIGDLQDRAIQAGGAEQSRLLAALQGVAGFNNQTRGQDIQEGLLERQQPLTEFNAFRTGNTPTLPQFQPYALTNVKPVDSFGATQAGYQADMNTFNANQGQAQSVLNFASKFFPTPKVA